MTHNTTPLFGMIQAMTSIAPQHAGRRSEARPIVPAAAARGGFFKRLGGRG